MNEVIEVNKVRIKKEIKVLTDEELWSKFIAEGLGELKDDFDRLKSMEIEIYIESCKINHDFFRDQYELVKNTKIQV